MAGGPSEVKVTRREDIGERTGEAADASPIDHPSDLVVTRPIALVGLMGAGKTTVGRRLAQALKLKFVDADAEIERAAGMKVSEIFAKHGEADFRRGERSVIARLLAEPPHVLATGGGAFIDPETRALMREKAISIWLKAPLEVLMRRVERRDDRPLLKAENPRAVMQELMDKRYPIYAEADIVVASDNGPHNTAVHAVIEALRAHLGKP
jgi:shikimate kinase